MTDFDGHLFFFDSIQHAERWDRQHLKQSRERKRQEDERYAKQRMEERLEESRSWREKTGYNWTPRPSLMLHSQGERT